MSITLTPRRPELLIRRLGGPGKAVVKDLHSGAFFDLGPEEAFLLERLDGVHTAQEICAGFESEFGAELTEEDLEEFLEVARSQGLLQPEDAGAPGSTERPAAPVRARGPKQSLLFYRRSLFDPDRFFGWLEPRIRFFWTRGFLAASLALIAAAWLVVWTHRVELARPWGHLRWETLALACLVLAAVTACHEFAHGLTCKHFGGSVHEVGLLLLFMMPGMYCNVSDSWLFPEKSKRLWVTAAGGYFELFLWALAVFTWRLTAPGCLVNDLAWAVVSVCGVRVLFNINPLVKLDGYYFLSDLLEIPNLRQRAIDAWLGHVRWALWGGARPSGESRPRLLLGLGVVIWGFSLGMVGLIALGLSRMVAPQAGWIAAGLALFLGVVLGRGLLGGVFGGEVGAMIGQRRKRAAAWFVGLGALPAALVLGQAQDWASGPFKLRPARRVELRAPVSGFLRAVPHDEGEIVSPGELIAELEIPDLDTKIAQAQAERDQARADLRKAEVGTRPEELAAQRQKVERARGWRDLARRDLDRLRRSHRERLKVLDEQIAEARAEARTAEGHFRRARALAARGFVSVDEYEEAHRRLKVADAQSREAEAQRRAVETEGTLEAEAELARRDKELADAEAALELLLAGSRPEDLDAARARLARLDEELAYLENQKVKLRISSPTRGLVATAHLRDKVGQYLHEGDLIGEIQTLDALEAEIELDEQAASRVELGREIVLKARALAFREFRARVERISPSALHDKLAARSIVTVSCRLSGHQRGLRPDMTGHARIWCGKRPIGEILAERLWGFLRTEFWL